MTTATLAKILTILKKEIKKWKVPAVGQIAEESVDRPFGTLISCLLSLRTKDAVTEAASRRLFQRASTPKAILELTPEEIEKLIYPAGFYRTKAKNILKICEILLNQYDGRVPDTIDQLLNLPGVGRKTANLVVTVGYDEDGICVDTHVHRISNRWGYIKTKTPDESEFALRKKLPKKYWKTYNDILVTFGQNLCQPVSPWCSRCALSDFCPKIGVIHRR